MSKLSKHIANARDKSLGRSVEEVLLRRKLDEASRNQTVNRGIDTAAALKTSSLPLLKAKQFMQTNNNERSAKVEVLYREEDVRKMMDEVMKYCKSLQNRVQVLEGELIQQSNIPQPAVPSYTFESQYGAQDNVRFPPILSTTNPQRQSFNNSRPATATSNLVNIISNNTSDTKIIHDMDKKILYLKEIFRQKDPLEERIAAAIKIQATIRGYLARVREQYYRQAIVEWRLLRCRPVIWLLDILLQEKAHLDAGMALISMNRTIHTLYSVFTKWVAIYRQNIPLRRKIKRLAEEKIAYRKARLLRVAFDGFRAVTVGILSRKHANNERQMLLDSIRKEISASLKARGLVGIVPPEEVETMLLRKVVEVFHQRKKVIVMQFKFKTLKDLVIRAKHQAQTASYFRFQKTAGKCFYAWSNFIYLVSMGLDRKRWPGPRKYEVRYNQKQVNYFTQIRIEKLVFGAWKFFFSKQKKVKVFRITLLTKRISKIVTAWRTVASYYRSLRKQVYGNWVGYARLIMSGPFSAWSDYVRGQRNRTAEHLRIAKSYIRWKSRQKLSLIMRTWRHQAVFGRIDGLYTRQMLLKTVSEQKIFITSLEKSMADQVLELEECKQVVLTEIEKRKTLEQDMSQLQSDYDKTKMQIHHYEEELKRLWSVLEAMRMIHPKPLEHLLSLQFNEFKFKERLFSFTQDVAPMQLNTIASGNEVGNTDPSQSANNNSASNVVDNAVIDEGDGDQKLPGFEGFSEGFRGGGVVLDDSSVEGSVAGSIGGLGGDDEIGDLLGEDRATTPEIPGANKAKSKGAKAVDDDGDINVDDDDFPSPMGAALEGNYVALAPGEAVVQKEELKLLERMQWLITRYKHSLPEDFAVDEEFSNAQPVEIDELANTSFAMGDNESVEANRTNSGNGNANGNDNGCIETAATSAFSSSVHSSSQKVRNSLLRSNNPFLKSRSQDDIAMSPSQKHPLRASFSRNSFASFINVNANNDNVAPDANNSLALGKSFDPVSPQSPTAYAPSADCFYSNEELEDVVITWAKMLFTFLEFLETGDITNLPQEDKRLWAQYLLEQANRQSEIPYEVFSYGHEFVGGDNGGMNPLQQAIQKALVTVDERMHGGMSWREALLTLRTMFPGAGNFSGFGVGLENPQDTALFTRLLRMRGELRKIEDYQQQRYQARFMRSMGLPKHRPAQGPSSLVGNGGKMFSVSETIPETIPHLNSMEVDNGGEETSYQKPLGNNIYASNLQKLLEQRNS